MENARENISTKTTATSQQIASDPSHSVWVSASAGTGKTKVLVDRVLRLMLDGVHPGKILCITFTKAAAAEMRNRIVETLSNWIISDDKKLANDIYNISQRNVNSNTIKVARQLFSTIVDNPENLKIQTIHSFCQSILQRFPLESGLSPHFRIIDEQTAAELLEEARQRLFQKAHHHDDDKLKSALHNIASNIYEGSFSDAVNYLIINRERFEILLQNYGHSGLVDRVYLALGVAKEDSSEKTKRQFCSHDSFDMSAMVRVVEALLQGDKKDSERGAKLKNWLENTENGRYQHLAEYLSAFLGKDNAPLKKLAHSKALAILPEAEEILQVEQGRALCLVEKVAAINTAKLTESLVHFGEAFITLYTDLKNHKTYLDYSDLITKVHALLGADGVNAWVMYKLDEGIEHILLDEAQDTSPEQWGIVKMLCEDFFAGESRAEEEKTFFAVGDEKQSIYSFQGADAMVFQENKRHFSEVIGASQRSWRELSLDRSYRSTEAVLMAVDTIFAAPELHQAITKSEQEIRHNIHRKNAPGVVEIWPVVTTEKKGDIQPWPLPAEYKQTESPAQIMANNIAKTISGWLEEGRLLPSKSRPVEPGDIMILVQRRSGGFMHTLIRALLKFQVDVAGVDRLELTEHIAVEDLIALGEFLLLPDDDLTLATLLKTPLLAMSEEDLFELSHGREGTLWSALRDKKSSYAKQYEYLSALLAMVDFYAPFELYSYILDVKGGRQLFIARLGEEVNDPIDEFLTLSIMYERDHTASMQGFLRWLKSGKIIIKRDMDQGQNAVRVMTIHGAKGLQAPIVFLPDTTKVPAMRHSVLWSHEHNIFLWPGKKENQTNLCRELIDDMATRQHHEYFRLLYVALTRAEDELYIGGYSSKSISKRSWYNSIYEQLLPVADKGDNFYSSDIKLMNNNSVLRITSNLIDEVKNEGANSAFISDNLLEKNIATLPKHFLEPMAYESALKISQPSRVENYELTDSNSQKFYRGKLVHSLLENLPDVPPEKREAAGLRMLKILSSEIDEMASRGIVDEVISVLGDKNFACYFGKNSRAEVPIAGVIDGVEVSGQIDRLVVSDNEVHVLDYKSNKNVPASVELVPQQYLKQMAAYKKIMEDIYPNKKVSCALLWTANLRLMALT